jgi:hypothetical protein
MTAAAPTEELVPLATIEHLDRGLDPVCEIKVDCPDHGIEQCEQRAEWIASWTCEHGHDFRMLVCDECHGDFVEGRQAFYTHDGTIPEVGWSKL